MTEDREQTTNEDREQTFEDVEGHSLTGHTTGQTGAGHTTGHTDDDDPDVEAHSLIGQTGAGQTTNQNTP